ncbi:MAG: hypothetical protein PVF43_13460, partial [Candidatus Eiseniibacteriota bacterium]
MLTPAPFRRHRAAPGSGAPIDCAPTDCAPAGHAPAGHAPAALALALLAPASLALGLVVLGLLVASCAREPATDRASGGAVVLDAWAHAGQQAERDTLERQVTRFNVSQDSIRV